MKNLLLPTLLFCCSAVMAQSSPTGDEWRNLQMNEVNRFPLHTTFFTYEDEAKALAGDKTASANYLSLNGTWQFKWVANADERPNDFYRTDLDTSDWGSMPVPGMWELNGYGDPIYVNIGFAWNTHYKNNPPEPPVKDNHVGSYRRTITLPADWKGKQVIAHFGSVTSNMYLYVNGKYVGYTEDSKVAAEFDITPYLKKGENLIAFQTFRWCDGSYCEDQDFWRLSGVGRDCYLYSRNKDVQVEDLRITGNLSDDLQDGILNIRNKTKGTSTLVEYTLLDADDNIVWSHSTNLSPSGELEGGFDNAHKWTAETPYLYTLLAKVYKSNAKGTKKKLVGVIPQKVGFRKIEIHDGRLWVNGQPVFIKGTNRHEMDPKTGYIMSRERMIEDLTIMKRLNINAIRTCHYPDDPLWYDLCDEYGFYLCAEANQEGHGFGYDDTSEAKKPQFAKQILERNQHNVSMHFNHPSIIYWSLGNETVDGPNFTAAHDWIRNEDSSRPIHWERAGKGSNSDIYCPMYISQRSCQKYMESNDPHDQKPLIQCEYSHAMGNSGGGFKEYWDLVRKGGKYQGGFIWDFQDQALYPDTYHIEQWKNAGMEGKQFEAKSHSLLYGGDYNTYDASDNNFNCNGFITADRRLTPQAYEIGYQYQNIWATLVDSTKAVISIKNEYFFRNLDNIRLHWRLCHEGVVVREGDIDNLDIPAQQSRQYTIPVPPGDGCGDLTIDLSFVLKQGEPMMAAGEQVAHQQFILKEFNYGLNWIFAMEELDEKPVKTSLDFDQTTGFIKSYKVNGKEQMGEDGTLRPLFWRAVTDNDMGAELQKKLVTWRNPRMLLKTLSAQADSTVATYDMPDQQATLVLTYKIWPNGALTVKQKLITTPGAEVPQMLRFGMVMQLPYDMDRSHFYGRGPIENYCDRNSGMQIGQYTMTVDEQFWPYVRPQECGTKSDVRWWRQYNALGEGLTVYPKQAICASALHYAVEDMDEGDEKDQRHPLDVPVSKYTNLYIDGAHAGVGGIDSWSGNAEALKQYRVKYEDREMEFTIIPL